MEEEKLIKKAKTGEREAFGALYDKYAGVIYRYIFLRCGGEKALAEDITHEVFLNAWKNIANYDLRGVPFLGYLYKIARNSLTDHWRVKKTYADIEDVAESNLVAKDDGLENKIDEKEVLNKIKSILPLMEPSYQEIILMKFVEDFSNKEISVMLGKSEGAIRVMQHRAIKQLKEYLKKYGKQEII
jgi:RNA polymerase sigma-70 factor (ECF subfamily)